jgi:hypothetical protein
MNTLRCSIKSFLGLERFAVRKYTSMQRLIFLAALAMGFVSYLLSRATTIRQKVDDAVPPRLAAQDSSGGRKPTWLNG